VLDVAAVPATVAAVVATVAAAAVVSPFCWPRG